MFVREREGRAVISRGLGLLRGRSRWRKRLVGFFDGRSW